MASEEQASAEELQVGARVCQRCQQPFVLVARSDEQHLALHLRAMAALVEQWQLPAYLVLGPVAGAGSEIVAISPDGALQQLTPEEYGEAQEQAYVRHRCPAAPPGRAG